MPTPPDKPDKKPDTTQKQKTEANPANPLIRLNKAIADSGYCARRKADALITEGHVSVNGQAVTTLGMKVDVSRDTITIHGHPLPQTEKLYLLFHKPVGVVTSRRGGRTQKTFYKLLPQEYQSVDPAGRLDQDSSGLLILSNDGDFLFQITHPRFHLAKMYEVFLDKTLTTTDRQKLLTGIRLEPENKLAKMTAIRQPSAKQSNGYQVTLVTGYNRQIRRSFAALGYRVKQLKRLSFGPIQLGPLAAGEIRHLQADEIARLLPSSSETPPAQPEKRQNRSQKKDGQLKNRAQQKRNQQAKPQR